MQAFPIWLCDRIGLLTTLKDQRSIPDVAIKYVVVIISDWQTLVSSVFRLALSLTPPFRTSKREKKSRLNLKFVKD